MKGDLIRRSDVLAEIEKIKWDSECESLAASYIASVVREMPAVATVEDE